MMQNYSRRVFFKNSNFLFEKFIKDFTNFRKRNVNISLTIRINAKHYYADSIASNRMSASARPGAVRRNSRYLNYIQALLRLTTSDQR